MSSSAQHQLSTFAVAQTIEAVVQTIEAVAQTIEAGSYNSN